MGVRERAGVFIKLKKLVLMLLKKAMVKVRPVQGNSSFARILTAIGFLSRSET